MKQNIVRINTFKACFFIIIATIFLSCKSEYNENLIVLSGKIENSTARSFMITDRFFNELASLKINEDGTFQDTIYLPSGYYLMDFGDQYTNVFLKPGYDLSISLNTKTFDKSINYSGRGAIENNYLAEKIRLSNGFDGMNYFYYYKDLNENDFLKITDSINKAKQALLQSQKDIDKEFSFIEAKAIEFEELNKYAYYSNYVKENGDHVSDSFPYPFQNVNINNAKLLLHPDYLKYVTLFLKNKSSESSKNKNQKVDELLLFVKIADTAISDKEIKEQILYETSNYFLNKTQELDSVYTIIDEALFTEEYKKQIADKYTGLKRTAKGSTAPVFELLSMSGDSVSLNDLKGKLVYIDIWATWCVPCLKEIPSLKKMKEHFKDEELEIVSICTFDSQEKWKKMVVEKELGSLQLFANKDEQFLQHFLVDRIPRFILLDKKGRIIDANAKRPSQPELWEEIKQYL